MKKGVIEPETAHDGNPPKHRYSIDIKIDMDPLIPTEQISCYVIM